jgi:hypothetical protein
MRVSYSWFVSSKYQNTPRGFAQCPKAACGFCGFCTTSLISPDTDKVDLNVPGTRFLEVFGNFGGLVGYCAFLQSDIFQLQEKATYICLCVFESRFRMRWYSVFVTTTLVGFKSTQKVIIWSFPT